MSLYRLRGWKVEGQPPALAKFIVIGAPHTSNWDFVTFLGATEELGIRASYIGKHSLFRWPLKRFMLDMGGIPIDRSKSANYVIQVAAEFARRDRLVLVVAPEGTRHPKGSWKSGFYHIATRAGVPIVPAWLDRKTRRAAIGPAMMPSGDYEADLEKLMAFYRAALPSHPRFPSPGVSG